MNPKDPKETHDQRCSYWSDAPHGGTDLRCILRAGHLGQGIPCHRFDADANATKIRLLQEETGRLKAALNAAVEIGEPFVKKAERLELVAEGLLVRIRLLEQYVEHNAGTCQCHDCQAVERQLQDAEKAAAEPRTTDYCLRCRCSPEASEHFPGRCQYQDPRQRNR